MNSERRRRNLGETGLEILGCRHSIAQKAISMHRGEIYSYAHFLQTNYLICNLKLCMMNYISKLNKFCGSIMLIN